MKTLLTIGLLLLAGFNFALDSYYNAEDLKLKMETENERQSL